MQSQATTRSPDDLRWTTADMLSVTLQQLRAWDAEAARHRVIQPMADEQAWEGTEIDVRRTVL